MIGFLIGAACLIGLVKTIRMGYGHRGWGGHHGRFGGGGCGDSHGFGGFGRGRGRGGWGERGRGGWGGGPRAALRALFERLDTSPGQEKVILGALEELWAKKRELGDEFVQTRRDVARAMRGERFDEVALGEAFTRQDALLAQLRESLGSAMKAVHEALDERQRKIAGDLLEGGFFGRQGRGDDSRGDGGPYRSNVWM